MDSRPSLDELEAKLEFETHERWLQEMLAGLSAEERQAILADVVSSVGPPVSRW
jgi:hypothetical protein